MFEAFEQGQTGPYCSQGVVLVGDRVPEQAKDPIAQVHRDVTAQRSDGLAAGVLIREYGLRVLIRIDQLRKPRGADEIGEQRGDLPPLTGRLVAGPRRHGDRCRRLARRSASAAEILPCGQDRGASRA